MENEHIGTSFTGEPGPLLLIWLFRAFSLFQNVGFFHTYPPSGSWHPGEGGIPLALAELACWEVGILAWARKILSTNMAY